MMDGNNCQRSAPARLRSCVPPQSFRSREMSN